MSSHEEQLEIMWVVRTHSVQQFPICSLAVSCLPFTQRWLDSHVLITFGLRHVILYFKTLFKNGFDGWLISVLRHTMSFFLSSLPHPDQAPAINFTSTQSACLEPAGAPSRACAFVPWECVHRRWQAGQVGIPCGDQAPAREQWHDPVESECLGGPDAPGGYAWLCHS